MLKKIIPTPLHTNSARANLFWATALQVIEKVVGYVVIAVLTRTLLQVELGTLFFALSISELTAVFLNFGTNTYLVRLIAADPDGALKYLSRVMSSRVINTIFGYIVLNLGVWLIQPELSPVMLFVAAYDFLEEIYNAFSGFFIGKKQLAYRLAILGGFKILTLLGISLVAYLTRALFPILWTYVIVDLLLVLACYQVIRTQFGDINLRFNLTDNLTLMKQASPFFMLNLLTILHMRFDTIMVGALLGLKHVAVYELGIKLMEVTRFFTRPLGNVFLPLFTEFAAKEQWKAFRRRFWQLIGLGLGVGVLLTVAMQAFGPYVIVWLFSERYRESVVPAQILFLSIPFLYIVLLTTIAANALHLEKHVTFMAALSVTLNLGLNLIIIPRFGISGAAWVTVISQAIQAVGMLILILPTLFKRRKSTRA